MHFNVNLALKLVFLITIFLLMFKHCSDFTGQH